MQKETLKQRDKRKLDLKSLIDPSPATSAADRKGIQAVSAVTWLRADVLGEFVGHAIPCVSIGGRFALGERRGTLVRKRRSRYTRRGV